MKPIVHQNLYHFIEAKQAVVIPMTPHCEEQIGNTCKIYGAYNLAAIYTLTHANQLPVHPARKKQSFNDQESLRHYAKQNLNSKVGEVYDPNSIINLLNYNNVPDVKTAVIPDPTNYIQTIKQKINDGHPVIAFCDVDNHSYVAKYGGVREHAIILIGYFTENNRNYFIYLSWGKFFCVEENLLAESANQLQNPRQPERFVKVFPGFWQNCDLLTFYSYPRHYKTENNTHATLKNTLIFSDQPLCDETQTPVFLNYKQCLINMIHTYLTQPTELIRRLNLCKNLSQLTHTISYYCNYGPGISNPLFVQFIQNYIENFNIQTQATVPQTQLQLQPQTQSQLQPQTQQIVYAFRPMR